MIFFLMTIYRKTGLGHLRERIFDISISNKQRIIKYNEFKQKDDKTKESEHGFVVNQQISESILRN